MKTRLIVLLLSIGVAILLYCASCIPGVFSLKSHPYVPPDLHDCFVQLDSVLEPSVKEQIQNWPEDSMINFHFGLGMWIRNNWGLWRGSRLSKWFNERQIWHPDDMSGIILTSYWRRVHNQAIDMEDQIKFYVENWAERKFPDSLKCPSCGRRLKNWFAQGRYLDKSDTGRIVTGLYCSKYHVWFYSQARGLYAIDTVIYRGYLDTLKMRGVAR